MNRLTLLPRAQSMARIHRDPGTRLASAAIAVAVVVVLGAGGIYGLIYAGRYVIQRGWHTMLLGNQGLIGSWKIDRDQTKAQRHAILDLSFAEMHQRAASSRSGEVLGNALAFGTMGTIMRETIGPTVDASDLRIEIHENGKLEIQLEEPLIGSLEIRGTWERLANRDDVAALTIDGERKPFAHACYSDRRLFLTPPDERQHQLRLYVLR